MAGTTIPQALDRSFNREVNAFIRKYAIVLIFIAMFVAMTFHGCLLQPRKLLNVVRQISVVGLIAIGVTMVIITTGIDLSSGSVLALRLSSLPALPSSQAGTMQNIPAWQSR